VFPTQSGLKSVEFSPNGQILLASCYVQTGQAPHVVACPITYVYDVETSMPLVVTADGWVHDFKTQSLIGKLPSIVSITTYSSSSSSIAFVSQDRQSTVSIMHFPRSELTHPGTSQLASLYSSGRFMSGEMQHVEPTDTNAQ